MYRRVRVLRDIFAFFGLNQQEQSDRHGPQRGPGPAGRPHASPSPERVSLPRVPGSPEKRVAFALLRLRCENPAAPIQEAEGTCCLKQGQRMKLEEELPWRLGGQESGLRQEAGIGASLAGGGDRCPSGRLPPAAEQLRPCAAAVGLGRRATARRRRRSPAAVSQLFKRGRSVRELRAAAAC